VTVVLGKRGMVEGKGLKYEQTAWGGSIDLQRIPSGGIDRTKKIQTTQASWGEETRQRVPPSGKTAPIMGHSLPFMVSR